MMAEPDELDAPEPDELAVRDLRRPDSDDSRPIEWWRSTVDWLRGKVEALRESDQTKGLPGALSALDTAEAAYERRRRRAEWEAAHGPEPEPEPEAHDPIREQLHRLDDRRARLFRVWLDAEIRERAYDHPDMPAPVASSEADYVAALAEQVDALLALPDDEIDAEYERLTARRDEVTDELFTRAEALRAPEDEAGSMPAPPEPALEAVGQRRTPDRPSGRVRAPEAMVIDIGSRADHDRAWHPMERRERP